jgi:hypothetical protein
MKTKTILVKNRRDGRRATIQVHPNGLLAGAFKLVELPLAPESPKLLRSHRPTHSGSRPASQ